MVEKALGQPLLCNCISYCTGIPKSARSLLAPLGIVNDVSPLT